MFNFQSQICRNYGSPEYHFGRHLSQLSDGSLNDSKWLVICELRQSKTRPVAELAFLADHTFQYKSGFWQTFAMTSSETSYMKNVANELSFLLVTHTTCFDIRFGHYGILKSGSISGQILDRLGHKCLIRFLGHKEGEICWGLNTKPRGNQLIFPTPTLTHVFNSRSNSLVIAEKPISQWFGGLATVLSYPGPRRQNQSLYTCAQDVQITHIVTI
jgi:hypothetical protein